MRRHASPCVTAAGLASLSGVKRVVKRSMLMSIYRFKERRGLQYIALAHGQTNMTCTWRITLCSLEEIAIPSCVPSPMPWAGKVLRSLWQHRILDGTMRPVFRTCVGVCFPPNSQLPFMHVCARNVLKNKPSNRANRQSCAKNRFPLSSFQHFGTAQPNMYLRRPALDLWGGCLGLWKAPAIAMATRKLRSQFPWGCQGPWLQDALGRWLCVFGVDQPCFCWVCSLGGSYRISRGIRQMLANTGCPGCAFLMLSVATGIEPRLSRSNGSIMTTLEFIRQTSHFVPRTFNTPWCVKKSAKGTVWCRVWGHFCALYQVSVWNLAPDPNHMRVTQHGWNQKGPLLLAYWPPCLNHDPIPSLDMEIKIFEVTKMDC